MKKAKTNAKPFISIIVLVSLLLTLIGSMTVFAVSADPPFTANVSIEGNTATVSVKTNKTMEYSSLELKFNEELPEGITLTSITDGDDIAAFSPSEAANIGLDNGLYGILNEDDNVSVESGKELVVYTFDISGASEGGHTIIFIFSAASDIDGEAYDWEDGTISAVINKGSAVVNYSVTLADAINGTASVSASSAAAGTEITITAIPDEGYELDKITYTPQGGAATDITSTGSFEMPDANVTVNITFKEADSNIVAGGECGENLTWVLDTNGTLTISGTGNMTDFTSSNIPWISYKSDIKNILINDGVTSIGERAFTKCVCLTNVEIPNSVTKVGSNSFSGCSSLINIEIPEGVWGIGNYAFSECSNLTSINIPSSTINIGSGAFNKCNKLMSINVAPDNAWYTDEDGILFNKKKTAIVRYPAGRTETNYTIPDGVTYISDAFSDCSNLESIYIPDSVDSLGESAFKNCSSLKHIEIPNGVTSISANAFNNCSDLESIYIPNGLIYIGHQAFLDCGSLKSIEIPNSVTGIGYTAFSGCDNLISVNIPDGVTEISYYTFKGCNSLAYITIPNSVTSIGESAFVRCSSLADVYYTGTEEQWNEITIADYNEPLQNATLHYNSEYDGQMHNITVITGSNGTASASTESAKAGTNITITAMPDDGYELDKITYIPEGGSAVDITNEKSFTMPESNVTVNVTFEEVTVPKYNIIVNAIANGTAEASAEQAEEGTTITITATPDDGYEIDSIIYTPAGESEMDITNEKSFIMPAKGVTVIVTFKASVPTSAAITVSDAKVSTGEEFSVPITLSENPGIVSMEFTVEYDEDLLEWTGVEEGEFGGSFDASVGNAITWFAGDPATNDTRDGVFAILKFTAREFSDGETTSVKITQIKVNYNAENIYDANEENVAFSVVPGEIKIIDYIPGDINGDGVVGNKDVTRLMRYIKYRDVEVVEAALDVNGDGTISNKDVTRLMRYIKYHDVEIY